MAAYKEISRRKLAALAAAIPSAWHLPADLVAKSATNDVNIMEIPRSCGLLDRRQLEITEKWDVDGLWNEITAGRLGAKEVCEAFCKRAAISHQLTRCITEPLFNSALERAAWLDAYFKRTGKPFGPLHGIPISVKDTFNIKHVDSSIGLAALSFKPAAKNAPIIDLLLSLGAVIVAKTNVPQTLAALDSVNNVFGRTLNPLNRKLTAGGSSGGEGVLVAMRGSMIGLGTDIGGSIRVPAMCNGIYGFKPSVGRVPFGGLQSGQPSGLGRTAFQAVGGPLASSVADLGAFMREVVPRAELWGEDSIPGKWESETAVIPGDKPRPFTVGILRSDGIIDPLPPIAKILDEVANTLRRTRDVQVVEISVPPALKKCQSLANALMGVDGARTILDLVESTSEPLIPWVKGRTKRGTPRTLDQMYELNTRRTEIEREMMKIWTTGTSSSSLEVEDKARKVDAIICPVAPHPVPEIDRYNAVGYTSSFVLLDYPAGTIPVRNFQESDLEAGKEITSEPWTSWDKRNRELWNSNTVDRRVYLDSPLSIQVVTPKQHDFDLYKAMDVIDRAIREQQGTAGKGGSRL